MKSIRTIATTMLLAVGSLTTIMYTSCDTDKCKDVVCQNGGTCTDGNCTCPTGYEGTTCQTETRSKYTGNWAAKDKFPDGSEEPYSSTIVAGSGNVQSVLISNFSNGIFGSATVQATVSGNTITIPSQKPNSNGRNTLSGTGTLNGTTLTWTYSVVSTVPSESYTATGTWTK